MRLKRGYMAVLFFFSVNLLTAQKVLYSPSVNDRFTDRFEVIGKTGGYYWIQKNKKKNEVQLPAMPWISDRQPTFEIYDEHLNQAGTLAAPVITDSTLKEYFVCSNDYFDQLLLLRGSHQTFLSLQRYAADGSGVLNKIIDSLPFNEAGNSFLLLRSENKSKILLLCFEAIADAPPRLHSLLYDGDWQLLSCNNYEHRYLSQPVVQYDFFNYPVEHFSTSAVKLTNSGEWMMLAPSGRNQNFSLFHFNGTDTGFTYREIKLPPASSVEDVALSLNNETGEAAAGILSRFRYSTLKNVQVSQYSLLQKKIVFDSSFRFNTLAAGNIKKQNLYEESFVAVPKAGFMLLKEYGKNYTGAPKEEAAADNNNGGKEIVFANNIADNEKELLMNPDEYTRYRTLAGPRSNYNRGDLSLFYFPAAKEDSCWSGIISKEQTTELNSSYLSYAIVPGVDRLYFLYNSLFRNDQQYGSSTILTRNGEEITDDGIVFSRIKTTLLFQKARQIAEREIAVPCLDYRKNGFAIIRF